MNCPRCTAHLHDDANEVVDTSVGIVAVLDTPTATRRAWCVCGWAYQVTSTRHGTRQPDLRLAGVA